MSSLQGGQWCLRDTAMMFAEFMNAMPITVIVWIKKIKMVCAKGPLGQAKLWMLKHSVLERGIKLLCGPVTFGQKTGSVDQSHVYAVFVQCLYCTK